MKTAAQQSQQAAQGNAPQAQPKGKKGKRNDKAHLTLVSQPPVIDPKFLNEGLDRLMVALTGGQQIRDEVAKLREELGSLTARVGKVTEERDRALNEAADAAVEKFKAKEALAAAIMVDHILAEAKKQGWSPRYRLYHLAPVVGPIIRVFGSNLAVVDRLEAIKAGVTDVGLAGLIVAIIAGAI